MYSEYELDFCDLIIGYKININKWMVSNGYAVAYKKYSKKFVAQENIAKKEKLGLWAGTFEMPWEWRKKN